MNNLLYPQFPQPISFVYLYAIHMCYRLWRKLFCFLVMMSVIDFFIIINHHLLTLGSLQHGLSKAQWGYLVLVGVSYYAWHWLLHQIKYITDHAKSSYWRSTVFVLLRIIPFIIFDILTIFTLFIATLLLVFPGIYVIVAYNLRLPLFILHKRPMVASLIDSIRLVKGHWFTSVFVFLAPVFLFFAMICLISFSAPHFRIRADLAIFLGCLVKNLLLTPLMACIYITMTHNLLIIKTGEGFISEHEK